MPHRLAAIKAHAKAFFQTEEGKKYKKEYQKRWREENPEKHAAHNALNNALRDGKIEKNPCEVCGDANSLGHHTDYSLPLDVMWLCSACHGAAHRKINQEARDMTGGGANVQQG